MGTVVGAWRLRLIVFLFIMLISVYSANALFINISVAEASFGVDENIELNENDTTEGLDKGQSFVDVVFGLGAFLTFDNIENTWARFMINVFVSICWIGIGYIMYTFVKEWIPLT